jgi:hypothetical protein
LVLAHDATLDRAPLPSKLGRWRWGNGPHTKKERSSTKDIRVGRR